MSIRAIVYSHTAAVCICGVFSYLDYYGGLPEGISPASIVLGVAFIGSLLAWFACPGLVIAKGLRQGLSWPLADAYVCEAILFVAQGMVLAPACQ